MSSNKQAKKHGQHCPCSRGENGLVSNFFPAAQGAAVVVDLTQDDPCEQSEKRAQVQAHKANSMTRKEDHGPSEAGFTVASFPLQGKRGNMQEVQMHAVCSKKPKTQSFWEHRLLELSKEWREEGDNCLSVASAAIGKNHSIIYSPLSEALELVRALKFIAKSMKVRLFWRSTVGRDRMALLKVWFWDSPEGCLRKAQLREKEGQAKSVRLSTGKHQRGKPEKGCYTIAHNKVIKSLGTGAEALSGTDWDKAVSDVCRAEANAHYESPQGAATKAKLSIAKIGNKNKPRTITDPALLSARDSMEEKFKAVLVLKPHASLFQWTSVSRISPPLLDDAIKNMSKNAQQLQHPPSSDDISILTKACHCFKAALTAYNSAARKLRK